MTVLAETNSKKRGTKDRTNERNETPPETLCILQVQHGGDAVWEWSAPLPCDSEQASQPAPLNVQVRSSSGCPALQFVHARGPDSCRAATKVVSIHIVIWLLSQALSSRSQSQSIAASLSSLIV